VIECPGDSALSRLDELRAEFRSTGKYAFLIGDDSDLETLRRFGEFGDQSSSEIVAESLGIDARTWFNEREAESRSDGFDQSQFLAEWPNRAPSSEGLSLHRDTLTKKIKPIVYIGLAEIEEPWILPAVTRFGGWNECPPPAVHCAAMRYWQSEYGAEIRGMCNDIIECTVNTPPATREAAMQLAWQQYWYCCDIVEQGTQSISGLAAELINSKYWFFWWD
jgi:hypothetical protein